MVSIISKWQSLSKEKDDGAKTVNAEQQQEDTKKIQEKGKWRFLLIWKVLFVYQMAFYLSSK